MLKKFLSFVLVTCVLFSMTCITNAVSNPIVYDGIVKVTESERCNPGDLYIARIYDSGSYGSCDYANLNKLKRNSYINVAQTKMLNDSAELTRVLNYYGFDATSKLKSELQYSSFRGSGYYYTVLFKYNSPQTINNAFTTISTEGYYKLHRLDLQKPNINGQNVFVVNVNKMLTKEEILSHVKAYDDTDGSVPVVIDSSTYNPSVKKTGDYNMVVSASDAAGNKAVLTLTIKVVDVDKPVISGTKTYTRSYDNPITLDVIKQAISITDNYDSDLTLNLKKDDYTGKERIVGPHQIVFDVTDSSNNNSGDFVVTVTVEDKTKPVITGPLNIPCASNQLMTIEEIISKFKATDGLDGDIILTSSHFTGYDTYKNAYNKVGTYTMSISVKDKNNNTQTQEFKITVDDKIKPEIWLDSYFIILDSNQNLTDEQIKEYAAKALGVSPAEIMSVEGDYSPNDAGEYNVNVVLKNGEKRSFNIIINEILEFRNLEWYEYIYVWFTVLFNINNNYKTPSFWQFNIRCISVSKIYSTGKILI